MRVDRIGVIVVSGGHAAPVELASIYYPSVGVGVFVCSCVYVRVDRIGLIDRTSFNLLSWNVCVWVWVCLCVRVCGGGEVCAQRQALLKRCERWSRSSCRTSFNLLS